MSLARSQSYAGLDAYKTNEISTVSQNRLIIMLYEGAVRFLTIARDNMTPRKYDLVNTNIIKAQDIITELLLSLNIDQGGEVGNNLMSLYVYLKKRLLEANMKKDKEILSEVMKHLIELKAAWEDLEKKTDLGTPANPQAIANQAVASTERKGGFSMQG